jgi:DNA-binding transcriptional ArsR family regulator
MALHNLELMQKHAQEAADLMKALSHPSRLMILCLLTQGEMCVGDLLAYSDLSQSSFSQHLMVLRQQGLVKTRKESQLVFYQLADDHSKQVIKLLHKLYCKQS